MNFSLNFKVVIMLLVNISLTKHIIFFHALKSFIVMFVILLFYYKNQLSMSTFISLSIWLSLHGKNTSFVNIMSQNGVNDVSIFIFILPKLHV